MGTVDNVGGVSGSGGMGGVINVGSSSENRRRGQRRVEALVKGCWQGQGQRWQRFQKPAA